MEDGEYTLHVATENVAAEDVEYTAYVYDKGNMAEPVAVLSGYIGDVGRRCVAKETLPLSYDEGSIIYVDVTHKDGTDRCFYRTGALTLSRTDGIEWSVDGDTLTVTARECVHAVEIESGLVPSDNYFTLFPGESRIVKLEKPVGEPVEYPITVDGYTHA